MARYLLVGLFCLALWPGEARGQLSALVDDYNRATALYGQGRYQESQPFFESALRRSEQVFGIAGRLRGQTHLDASDRRSCGRRTAHGPPAPHRSAPAEASPHVSDEIGRRDSVYIKRALIKICRKAAADRPQHPIAVPKTTPATARN